MVLVLDAFLSAPLLSQCAATVFLLLLIWLKKME